ncbi:hypothetical protein D9M69_485590 [compost metagenome]
MVAMPCASASWGEANTTFLPFRLSSPPLGACAPEMMRISVDLPAPLSPQMAMTLPCGTSRSMPFRASTAPYDFLIWRSDNAAVMAAGSYLAGCRNFWTLLASTNTESMKR